MTDLVKIFTDARAILADPTRWTQGTHARDSDGEVVHLSSDKAVCFCLDGALAKVTGVVVDPVDGWSDCEAFDEAAGFLRVIARKMTGQSSYVAINDNVEKIPLLSPHEAVLAVLDRALDQLAA